MQIRIATTLDHDNICAVHLRAFAADENEIVSKLATDLLAETTTPPTISLVAETEDAVVGHVAFSPVVVEQDVRWQGYIMAPLGVTPDHQKHRIGSTLIENGIQRLTEMGVHILFVYGDPEYYSKFGFSTEAAERFTPPYELQYPSGWQAVVLDAHKVTNSPVNITCVTSLCDPALW